MPDRKHVVINYLYHLALYSERNAPLISVMEDGLEISDKEGDINLVVKDIITISFKGGRKRERESIAKSQKLEYLSLRRLGNQWFKRSLSLVERYATSSICCGIPYPFGGNN